MAVFIDLWPSLLTTKLSSAKVQVRARYPMPLRNIKMVPNMYVNCKRQNWKYTLNLLFFFLTNHIMKEKIINEQTILVNLILIGQKKIVKIRIIVFSELVVGSGDQDNFNLLTSFIGEDVANWSGTSISLVFAKLDKISALVDPT